jgi:predicted Zn finger-like uncharacterized protein
MPVEALCPTCGAVFSLKDEYAGKKVRCKKCEHTFVVGGGKSAADEADKGVQSRAGAAPARKSTPDDDNRVSSRKGKPDKREDDDDRPRKSASRRGRDDDDEDDDRGRKRKRVYHDDDEDEDDDRPRPAARKSSGGGAGKVLAIVGSVLLVLFLLCGGAIWGFVRWTSRVADDFDQAMQQAQQQAQQDAANAQGGMGFPPGFPADMFPPGPGRRPANMAEALTNLKGNDANDRREAANWLATQPLDAARQKEVAQALEPLVKDIDDNLCAAGARGLKTWGTKDNGPALTQALKQRLPSDARPFFGDAQKELMWALATLKYEPGAEVVAEFLPNFFAGGETEKVLDAYGPAAEKAVVKIYHHKDGGVREKARRLVDRYNTKPAVILDQTVDDLRAVDMERAKAAAEWLSRPASDEALKLANAEPARRGKVAVGLNRLLDPPPTFFEDTALLAVRRWGTKDNVPSLVHFLTTTPFKKREVADALIGIGPACRDEVAKLIDHPDQGVRGEAGRILKNTAAAGEAGNVELTEALVDLKSGDFNRTNKAGRYLQTAKVDEKQRAVVVAALLDALKDTGVQKADGHILEAAKAVPVWATKEDGQAVVDRVRDMHKFFCRQSRKVLIDWMGKEKIEKAIPLLAASLLEREESQTASAALQAMGPEHGAAIEAEIGKLSTNDLNQLGECMKVLGAVGTKKSLDLIKRTQAVAVQRKNNDLALLCTQAITAINGRNK